MDDLVDVMAGLYEALDARFLARIGGRPVSCRRGCTACCHQIVAVGPSEAIYLATDLLGRPDWKAWAERCAVAARALCAPDVTRHSWFERRVPCVFLDPSTGDCRVYAKRPGACRWYSVRTPPENCAPGAANPYIAHYNSDPEVAEIVALDTNIHRVNPALGQQGAGPLPMMVLLAMSWLLRDEKKPRRFVRKLLAGLPAPREWYEAFVARHRRTIGDAWTDGSTR